MTGVYIMAHELEASKISSLIQSHCQKLLAAETLQEDPGLYIPAHGMHTPHTTSTFDLFSALRDFIAGNKEVLLLMGESGTGKSLFAQTLVQQLAKTYTRGESIPLFISLPTLREPKNKLMEEVLARHGFPPESLLTLKQNHRFFLVLDAYDELNMTENFYRRNKLNEWKVKILYTCRGSYLTPITNYQSYFIPFREEKSLHALYQEMYVAPFSPQQIVTYIQQYIQNKQKEIEEDIERNPEMKEGKWLIAQTYRDWIEQIPGLRPLVQTPFLLKITMQVLPKVVTMYQQAQNQKERFHMTQAKLYDAFVAHWFGRQEEKLIGLDIHPGKSLYKDYLAFSKALAKKMHERRLNTVTYAEESDLLEDVSQPSEWAMFFSNEFVPSDRNNDERRKMRVLARKGCPLRKVAEDQYAFIHTSLSEYFVTLVVRDELLKNQQALPPEPLPAAVILPALPIPSAILEKLPELKRPETPVVEVKDKTLIDTQGSIEISLAIPYQDLVFGKSLGQGAYGIVYRGEYKYADVAIKKLLVQELDQEALDEFKHEASVMAKLRSPYIVQLYGVCLEKPYYSMVMEYLSNGSLYSLLHADQAISWTTRYQIGVDVSCGLAYLHHQNIIHADLKSLNILLDKQTHAKITDFGLSKVKSTSSSASRGASNGGSVRWMAPELFDAYAKTTKLSDVFSFAIVLWELGSRKIPYEKKAPRNEVVSILICKGVREEINKETPPSMAALIAKCWDGRAEQRPSIDDAVKILKEEQLSYKFST
jgi:tRNA A-37 threonylcarbamoyl transferase component Bud32